MATHRQPRQAATYSDCCAFERERESKMELAYYIFFSIMQYFFVVMTYGLAYTLIMRDVEREVSK